MTRKYTKKSDYWNKFSKGTSDKNASLEDLIKNESSAPQIIGDPFYDFDSSASYSRTGGDSTTGTRRNRISVKPKIYKYANIREGLLPFEMSINGYNVRDAIELCQKAYANVAIFRNAVDIMSEFSNAEIVLEGGSQKSRDFFTKWMKYVKMWRVKDQYFREYYRSGNIFFYKINAKFQLNDFQRILQSYANNDELNYKNTEKIFNYPTSYDVKNSIPVQYTLLNPFYLTVKRTSSWKQVVYEKILSEYELERLQNPKNDHDKMIYDIDLFR